MDYCGIIPKDIRDGIERGQMFAVGCVNEAAWAHKANIDALPDHVVEMYDVTAGWPA